ncbi:hypothetical protein [Peribacillus sp. SI8-4]|uniref:hypothetical protein n=1 Tax=Peribacillus sp. SI8-4 TaxID=3048009 RepID=UPI00255504F6|nr:hypothetical protein [Peribacillus sp. SI8-4]
MGLFSMIFKTAKEMDKQRFNEIDRQKKLQEKQNKINIQEKLVDEYFINLTKLYNEWGDAYNNNEELRESIDIEGELDAFLENFDTGILLTNNLFDRVELLPDVYEVPKPVQQYIKASKEQYLLNLEFHIKRDETIKNGVIEFLEKGEIVEHPPELVNQYLNKAHLHLETAQSNMVKARQSIHNI